MVSQEPAESVQRIGVVKAQAHPLAPLQGDLAIDHGYAQIARGLKLPGDDAETLMPLVATLIEANLAVILGDSHACQWSEGESLADGIIARRKRGRYVVDFRIHNQAVA